MKGRDRGRRWRWRAVVVGLVTVLGALAVALAGLRLPPGPGVLQRPGPSRHEATRWRIAPAYIYDALCFFNLMSGDPFYLDLFEGTRDADFARSARAGLTSRERAAVDRLSFVLQRGLGAIPCAVWSAMAAITGADDLAEFRAAIADPRRFRVDHAAALDVFYRRSTGGFRLPGFVVDRVLRDLSTYLGALDRLGFDAYWSDEVRPDLEALAFDLRAGVADFEVVPVVESLLGGGLPSDEVRVHLARFARPNGISLQATSLVMEERTDAPHLARVAAHEMLHGWVDWGADPVLVDLVAALRRDEVVARAYRGRDRHGGYATWVALAEEGLTQALDQLVAERLGMAEDPRERWFFHDGGLHVAGLGWHRLLRDADYPGSARPGQTLPDWLAAFVRGGGVPVGRFGAIWDEAFGSACMFEAPGEVGAVHLAGDPALAALHPSYEQAMRPGMAIVFLRDWCRMADANEGVAALESAARRWDATVAAADGREVPLTFLFAGNWSVEREGATYLYRHSLYYRLPGAVAPDALRQPLEVRIQAEGMAGGG